MSAFIDVIQADDDLRHQAFEELIAGRSSDDLLREASALDQFRRTETNLYRRVRALLLLYAIHRYALPERTEFERTGWISFRGYEHFLARRFEDALDVWLGGQQREGAQAPLSSALAAAYHGLAFQTLADQVSAKRTIGIRERLDV